MKRFLFNLLLILNWEFQAQHANIATYTFDFNEQQFKEKNNKIQIKAIGATLTEDRFGNPSSAAYLHGSEYSYLNLGTSKLLKPQVFTISIWVNLDIPIYAGSGDFYNPIIGTKNPQAHDFFNVAYSIGYPLKVKRMTAGISKDSVCNLAITAKEDFVFGRWHHLAFVVDYHNAAFYVDGTLEQRITKNFKLDYLETDSIMVGNNASKKNNRWSMGRFDDIQFFNQALTEKEILDLYLAPNPNIRQQNIALALKFGSIIIGLILLIIISFIRNRRILNRQKQRMELINKISELELKVVKSQINPKFISDCLNAIRDLINEGNTEKAGQYIAKFSLYLRMVLNFSDRSFICLKDELEVLRLNLELEALVYRQIFKFKYNCDQLLDLKESTIPALITLPFIENAVLNAVNNKSELRLAEIDVRVYKSGENIGIEIANANFMRDRIAYKAHSSKGQELVSNKMSYLNELSKSVKIDLKTETFQLQDKQATGTRFILEVTENLY